MSLDGIETIVEATPGQLLIEALEAAGLSPPNSCRMGMCATCMCVLEEGKVEMQSNGVLDDTDLAAGWVLSCQSVALTPTVRIRYP